MCLLWHLLQDPDDVGRVHWAMKRFISWQQQQLKQAAAAAVARQQPQQQQQQPAAPAGSSGVAAGAGGGGGGGGGSSNQQASGLQQQFQQLLGPHLQLLSAAQAAALEAPCLQAPLKAQQQQQQQQQLQGSSSQPRQQQSQQQQPGGALPDLVGVLAGLLNPGHPQQWLPGGCQWDSLQVALLEVLHRVATGANAPVEAWEAAAALLRYGVAHWVGRGGGVVGGGTSISV